MIKIKAGNDKEFDIDNLPYQRGAYEIFKNTTRVGLRRSDGTFLVVDELDQFVDASDASFANLQAFVDYVRVFIYK